jgi:hypothetical protein
MQCRKIILINWISTCEQYARQTLHEINFTEQNLRDVRPSFCVAKKMDARLGRCQVLFRPLSYGQGAWCGYDHSAEGLSVAKKVSALALIFVRSSSSNFS